MGHAAPPVALYVHIPFCVSLCPYCDFVVYPGAAARGPKARVDAFLAALHAELDLRADAVDAAFPSDRPPLETVYLGGGTPSLLPAPAVKALLDRVRARYGIADGAEVTLEANPGPDERGDAAALRAAGVTRLSIGAQAMSASALRRLGRRHRVVDVVRAVAEAREGGIASVSLDLLYDAPDATLVDWIETLEAALALEPDHLSLYALTLDDPDAEGLTGPDGDHLPTPAGARRWRPLVRDRTRTARRPNTTTLSIGSPRRVGTATRSATGRDQDTRAGTTSSTGRAAHTRLSGRAPTRSMA
jgi:oxygen-independent coproporphyrinogen-3 oxidase